MFGRLWRWAKNLVIPKPKGKIRLKIAQERKLPLSTRVRSMSCNHDFIHVGQKFVQDETRSNVMTLKNCSRCVRCLKVEFYSID